MEARFNLWLERHDARVDRVFAGVNIACFAAAALFFVGRVCQLGPLVGLP